MSNRNTAIFSLFFLSFLFMGSLASCKKEDKKNIVPPELKASAVINGSFTTLTDTELAVSFEDGNIVNKITLSRIGGIRIVLKLPGTSRASFDLLSGNAIPNAKLVDQQNRNFICKNGKAAISDYYNRDGQYKISGSFEFDAEYHINDTTSVALKVRQGGFVNVQN